MKKSVLCLLAVAFTVMLCACGTGDRKTSDTGTQSTEATSEPTATAADPEPTIVPEAQSEEQALAEAEETPSNPFNESSEAPDEPKTDADVLRNGDRLFTLGKLNGDIYESPFLGYRFRLENWIFADEEKIAERNRWDAQMYSSELQEEIRNADLIIEMFAESKNGLEYLTIQYQKNAYFAAIDLETWIDRAIPETAERLKSEGYRDIVVEKTTVTLGGDVYPGTFMTGKIYGAPIFQKQAYIQRGDYIAFVTVTSRYDNTVDDIFAAFYKLV